MGLSRLLRDVPRKTRENVEGGVYHVYARGIAKRLIYHDDADRQGYLSLLERVIAQAKWRCLSYCLMENHVHLLLETPQANLSAGMQRLHGKYGAHFNERHGRVGHVFQGRYGATRQMSQAQLWVTAAYVARNPIEAGLCERPEQWPWSSHRAVLGGPRPAWLDVDRLLSHFDGLGSDPRRLYATLTAGAGVPQPAT